MKIKLFVLALVVPLLLASGTVQAFSAREYQGLKESEREYFILGLLYGFFVGSATLAEEAPLTKDQYLKFPYLGCANHRLDAIIADFISDHPDMGDKNISEVLFQALREACPEDDALPTGLFRER